MASLGTPIDNDPLYPRVRDVAADDFTRPLALLAHSVEFIDPKSGRLQRFVTRRTIAGCRPNPTAGHPGSPPPPERTHCQ